PVVPDEVGGRDVEERPGFGHRRPAGPQPGERLRGDLVGRLVVVDQASAPAGEARVEGGEELGGRLLSGPFEHCPGWWGDQCRGAGCTGGPGAAPPCRRVRV